MARQILLVGNYEADGQKSMTLYCDLLADELRGRGRQVDVLKPAVVLGALSGPPSLMKWVRYFDKYLLFPLWWMVAGSRRVPRNAIVHITDHSNAVYVRMFRQRTVVTCHDLLAVRGALGEDTDCPASGFGRLLQKAILRGLVAADYVICDSDATRQDLLRLGGSVVAARSSVVLLPLNGDFSSLSREDAELVLSSYGLGEALAREFVLHVGSSLARKNRVAVLRVLADMRRQGWGGFALFVGAPLNQHEQEVARALLVADDVHVLRAVPHDVLVAAYRRAFSLLFPSTAEGFGWPVIEAQAAGCPVVCSDVTSVPEVAGTGAFVRGLRDESGMAEDLLRLRDPSVRHALVAAGYENLTRFSAEAAFDRYVQLYSEVAA